MNLENKENEKVMSFKRAKFINYKKLRIFRKCRIFIENLTR